MSRHVSVRLEEEGFERLERQRQRSGEGRSGHRSEIDDWIERNRGEAELAEAAWRRERQLLA